MDNLRHLESLGDWETKETSRWVAALPRLLEVLSDDATAELVARMPYATRMRTSKDLGETMVVAHAVGAAERGGEIIVLIDDQGG